MSISYIVILNPLMQIVAIVMQGRAREEKYAIFIKCLKVTTSLCGVIK